MANGLRVVGGVELVHDSRVTANLAVLVGEPGASGTSRSDEQVDLRQLARNVGVCDVWVAPTDRKMPESFSEKHSACPSAGFSDPGRRGAGSDVLRSGYIPSADLTRP